MKPNKKEKKKQRQFILPINVKLIALFLIIALVPFLLTAFLFIQTSENALEKQTRNQLDSVATLKENQFNGFIEEEKGDLESIAKEKSFLDDIDNMFKSHSANKLFVEEESYKHIKGLLNEKLTTMGNDFIEFFIINLDGEVHISTDKKQEGKIKSDEIYFIEGQKNTFLKSFYYSLALQQPAITISTPLKNKDGNLMGVLAGRIDTNQISNMMIERPGLGVTGETILVNKYNLLVSKSRFIEDIEFKKTIYAEAVKRCLKKETGFGSFKDYRDIQVQITYRWIEDKNVCLIAKIDQEEAFEPINDLKNRIVIILAIVVPIILAFSYFFSRTIVNPINNLMKGIEEISKGNLNYEFKVKTKDEFRILADSFNNMRKEIKLFQNKLKRQALGLEKEVGKRTKQLQSKIDELEKFSKVTVGRELKMIELKKRIKDLEGKSNK